MAPFSVFENAGSGLLRPLTAARRGLGPDELLEHYVAATRAIVVGDESRDPGRPLVSAAQRETVEGVHRPGRRRGRDRAGGRLPARSSGLAGGFYLRPTVLGDCTTRWWSRARRSSGRSSR